VLVGLETIERLGEQILADMLNNLDTDKREALDINQLVTPQLQALLNQISMLDKAQYGMLYAIKDMVENLQRQQPKGKVRNERTNRQSDTSQDKKGANRHEGV
jgi:hypothetical protein